MSTADGLFGLMRDVLLFRENISAVRREMAGLADDVVRLANDHAALSIRVARIEGFLDGAAATAAPRARRLPKA